MDQLNFQEFGSPAIQLDADELQEVQRLCPQMNRFKRPARHSARPTRRRAVKLQLRDLDIADEEVAVNG